MPDVVDALRAVVRAYDRYLVGATDGVPFAEAIEQARVSLAQFESEFNHAGAAEILIPPNGGHRADTNG
jgi:hypothetical protein